MAEFSHPDDAPAGADADLGEGGSDGTKTYGDFLPGAQKVFGRRRQDGEVAQPYVGRAHGGMVAPQRDAASVVDQAIVDHCGFPTGGPVGDESDDGAQGHGISRVERQ